MHTALMDVYGLTGGIATGKSTVAKVFSTFGIPIIDADLVAREVVLPGQPALLELERHFKEIISPSGHLDRQKLAERVFRDNADRSALNAIVHPYIQQVVREKMQALSQQGAERVIYDAALLIENGLHNTMQGLVLVIASPPIQIARLMQRDKLSPQAAAARIASQMPLEEKCQYATWIINNEGLLNETKCQVQGIFNAMSAQSPKKSKRQ